MSRNNKNARNHAAARAVTAMHKSGNRGPAKTSPSHGKKNVRWKMNDTLAARVSILTKQKPKSFLDNLRESREKSVTLDLD